MFAAMISGVMNAWANGKPTGSLQNPSWSPDGSQLAFTRWRGGYNKGAADVCTYSFKTCTWTLLVSNDATNVTQPGSCWNKDNEIIFSSDIDGHDEAWKVNVTTRTRTKLTARDSYQAYEPSWCPGKDVFVFESHPLDVENNGIIYTYSASSRELVALTEPDGDCRQPNWSPDGKWIVYQQRKRDQWDLWLYDVQRKRHHCITENIEGDKTDATFSPDSRRVLYSGARPNSDEDGLLYLPVAGGPPVPVQHGPGYHGAASWHPTQAGLVAVEYAAGDPEDTGTVLALVDFTGMRKSMQGYEEVKTDV